MVPELWSCVAPPSIEFFGASRREYQLLSVSDPEVIKRELLSGYSYLDRYLSRLNGSARSIARDLTEGLAQPSEEIEARVDSFADSLQYIICQARFICYLYL